jgi:hypothetical protein
VLLSVDAAIVARLEALVARDASAIVVACRGGIVRAPSAGSPRIRHMVGATGAGLVLVPRLASRYDVIRSAASPSVLGPRRSVVGAPAASAAMVIRPATIIAAIGTIPAMTSPIVIAAAPGIAVVIAAAAAAAAAVIASPAAVASAAASVASTITAAASATTVVATAGKGRRQDRTCDHRGNGRRRERGQHRTQDQNTRTLLDWFQHRLPPFIRRRTVQRRCRSSLDQDGHPNLTGDVSELSVSACYAGTIWKIS